MLKKKYILKEISILVYFTDTFLSAKYFEPNFIEIFMNSDGAHGMPATTKARTDVLPLFFTRTHLLTCLIEIAILYRYIHTGTIDIDYSIFVPSYIFTHICMLFIAY